MAGLIAKNLSPVLIYANIKKPLQKTKIIAHNLIKTNFSLHKNEKLHWLRLENPVRQASLSKENANILIKHNNFLKYFQTTFPLFGGFQNTKASTYIKESPKSSKQSPL